MKIASKLLRSLHIFFLLEIISYIPILTNGSNNAVQKRLKNWICVYNRDTFCVFYSIILYFNNLLLCSINDDALDKLNAEKYILFFKSVKAGNTSNTTVRCDVFCKMCNNRFVDLSSWNRSERNIIVS